MMIKRRKDGSIDGADLTYLEVLVAVIFLAFTGQVVIFFLPFSCFSVSIGWWIGIAGAVFMETHLYHTVSDIVMMSEKDADATLRKDMFIRYGVIFVIMAALYLTKIINPVAYVIGVMMLKPAVYLQPITDKIYTGLRKRFGNGVN